MPGRLRAILRSGRLFVVVLLAVAIGLFLYNIQATRLPGVNVAESPAGWDVTVIVSIAGLCSAIGALVFSSISQSSQNKNQYYQILKDFEAEYTKLGEMEAQLRSFVVMTFEELSRQPRETIEEVELYRWKFYQFHERMAHLALHGIIPREIARYYTHSFGTVLSYIEIDFDPQLLRRELYYIAKWCRNEGIARASSAGHFGIMSA